MPATTEAQAPVPHARVIPQPLSQTSRLISERERIFINSTFVFSGKTEFVSISEPYFNAADFVSLSVKIIRHGLQPQNSNLKKHLQEFFLFQEQVYSYSR